MEQEDEIQKNKKGNKYACVQCRKAKKRCKDWKLDLDLVDSEAEPKIIPCNRCSEQELKCDVTPYCIACNKKLTGIIGFCSKEECQRVQISEKELREKCQRVQILEKELREECQTVQILEKELRKYQILFKEMSMTMSALKQENEEKSMTMSALEKENEKISKTNLALEQENESSKSKFHTLKYAILTGDQEMVNAMITYEPFKYHEYPEFDEFVDMETDP
ncbi:9705_t:CDS:2 [Scutellospora calospora]|uniref:9705_t:CDS:1 n=1 Tax=Scutellospora calospora TaxID=85575 RepID=A0ACA9KZB7_9GLOM|nr:9705_t:CDS:2 [Scutellospora calospora]